MWTFILINFLFAALSTYLAWNYFTADQNSITNKTFYLYVVQACVPVFNVIVLGVTICIYYEDTGFWNKEFKIK